jgi:hypothetical protein
MMSNIKSFFIKGLNRVPSWLLGALFAVLFFAVLSILARSQFHILDDWQDRCGDRYLSEHPDHFSISSCSHTARQFLYVYLLTLSYGPAFMIVTAPDHHSLVFTISCAMFAIIGGFCFYVFKSKQGFLAFLIAYVILLIPTCLFVYVLVEYV